MYIQYMYHTQSEDQPSKTKTIMVELEHGETKMAHEDTRQVSVELLCFKGSHITYGVRYTSYYQGMLHEHVAAFVSKPHNQ
jgi:hypothetical protein